MSRFWARSYRERLTGAFRVHLRGGAPGKNPLPQRKVREDGASVHAPLNFSLSIFLNESLTVDRCMAGLFRKEIEQFHGIFMETNHETNLGSMSP